ncbi:MAG: uroporphyrinogen decarboxylase family protein, partial [Clostridiales bacterium]|nr:uroporphyrinogen decarboxylase family protein [Clostridiales bacterium]
GKDLALMGGIDKRILAGSKEGIYEEVMKILDFMLPIGGYIPTVDHTVPPDVSLENFMYYLEIKKRALEGKI